MTSNAGAVGPALRTMQQSVASYSHWQRSITLTSFAFRRHTSVTTSADRLWSWKCNGKSALKKRGQWDTLCLGFISSVLWSFFFCGSIQASWMWVFQFQWGPPSMWVFQFQWGPPSMWVFQFQWGPPSMWVCGCSSSSEGLPPCGCVSHLFVVIHCHIFTSLTKTAVL